MTEAELERTAARLGESAARDLDGERIATRVLARLATEPVLAGRPRRGRLRVVFLGLAAAALLLLAVRFTLGGGAGPSVLSPQSPLSVLSELDELNAAELEVLLEAIPPPADSLAGHPNPSSLYELDVKSLERLLRSLEG